MRQVSSVSAAVLLLATASYAQAPSKAAVEKAVVANENAVNEAVAKNDLAGFKKLVASDAWSVDPGGVMPVSEFEKIFAQVKVEPGWKISASKLVWIGDNAVIHIYRWTGKGSIMGQPFGDTYSSTVWVQRAGNWVAVFHQETPVPPPAPKK